MKHRRLSLSTTHIILFSFLIAVIVGSVLLALPWSSADGEPLPYIDALFTATTATCVTGLVTVPTAATWSLFGQIVILLLIQIGGLGIVTLMTGVMIVLHRRMGLSDRLLIQDAFNLNTLSGLVRFVKKVILGTLIVEGVGALLYMPVFVADFGARGVWIAVFNAVSAFCNAGIDIIGDVSLCDYATHPLVNTVTALLIVMGGLGYIVWWDLLRVFKEAPRRGLRCLKSLTLHSKIALTATAILIVGGGAAFFLLEYNNPLTLQGHSLFNKIQLAMFQSVTTRTAGFAAIPQQHFTNASSVVSMLLMSIGGSPVGTAGGIKTVTAAVLCACAYATVRSRRQVTLFDRQVAEYAIRKSVAVTAVFALIVMLSTVLLSAVSDFSLLDVAYETISATATVGLTRGITPLLNVAGKIILIVTMYLGRVGPISLAIALNIRKDNQNAIKNPAEDISVG